MELVDSKRLEVLKEALNFLEENLKKHLGAEVKVHILNKDNHEILI